MPAEIDVSIYDGVGGSHTYARQRDYWFHAKQVGSGWGLPANKQGWVFFGLMFAIFAAMQLMIIIPGFYCDNETFWLWFTGYMLGTALWTVVLIGVCCLKGDPKGRHCNM